MCMSTCMDYIRAEARPTKVASISSHAYRRYCNVSPFTYCSKGIHLFWSGCRIALRYTSPTRRSSSFNSSTPPFPETCSLSHLSQLTRPWRIVEMLLILLLWASALLGTSAGGWVRATRWECNRRLCVVSPRYERGDDNLSWKGQLEIRTNTSNCMYPTALRDESCRVAALGVCKLIPTRHRALNLSGFVQSVNDG